MSNAQRILLAAVVITLALPALAQAQALITLTQGNSAFDDLERAAAIANQGVYDALLVDCAVGPGPNCTVPESGIFDEVRELVETANELLANGGPVGFSLGLDQEGLGDALRWTAAEEVSAKGRATTDFANGQNANVTSRITALRYGATGFSIAGLDGLPARELPDWQTGDTLSAAGLSDVLGNLGGFLNATYGWGEHDPTTFEDAFDYENLEFTAGVDYRFLPQLVGGLVAGYTDTDVDFDGSKSIVDGGITSEGFSVGAFGVYSWKDVYVSGFVNYQRMKFDIDRFITYPSLNPNVPSTNTRTAGDTDSDAVTLAATVGYTYRFGLGTLLNIGSKSSKPFLIEPSFRIEYTNITIQGYSERQSDGSSVPSFFSLRIQDQDIESLELTVGIRSSVAVSTPIGVFFPYVRVEWRSELEDSERTTTSQYAGVTRPSLTPFLLDSGEIDTGYGTVVAGVQTILLGGQQKDLGGPVGNRLSIFGEYRTVFALENIQNDLVSGGIRYTF